MIPPKWPTELLLAVTVELYQTEVSEPVRSSLGRLICQAVVDLQGSQGSLTSVYCARMRQLYGHKIDMWYFKNMRRSP
jgi:hypothetical protein